MNQKELEDLLLFGWFKSWLRHSPLKTFFGVTCLSLITAMNLNFTLVKDSTALTPARIPTRRICITSIHFFRGIAQKYSLCSLGLERGRSKKIRHLALRLRNFLGAGHIRHEYLSYRIVILYDAIVWI